MWATTLFETSAALPSEATGMVAGLASLAGAGCALAYFAGSDDTSESYQKAIATDPITGILSRDGLQPELLKLAAAIDEKLKIHRLFLISMDFDELRDINDIYGAETGNAVLRVIAQRLKLLIGDAGSLARTNGSEFVVALKSGYDERELRAAVLALMETMSQPVRIGAVSYPVYANGGVVEVHKSSIQIEKLLRRAALARTHAKASGRGSYAIYHPEMSHQASYRQWIETELTFAMERKEFSLHYQPQFDVRKGKIVGYEALVRWMHREKGAISPVEFIPVAESCGFIQQLGSWVLKRACHDALRLPDSCKVSVNVSTTQLECNDFLNTLRVILAETGLDPKRIELEVTESLLIRDHINMRRLLRSIRELGISIAIDDFGTGYSNLINLSELEFDKIKIDKSFVDRVSVNNNSAAMIATIVSLAHSMNASVVAEGIETEQQSILLQAAGCSVMQGYYYGKPIPLSAAITTDKQLAA
ncbi:MAG: bifunctional diguanylate cyclase/phosphodiesterase [Ahrensia sp.]|nr:bifunctional diguanylate cyclase/phosphodiesterase [Ahrensia sp.]